MKSDRLVALVVEDTEAHVETIRHRLEREHVDVVVARDGQAALAAIEEGNFHFAIVDLGLPPAPGERPEAELGYDVIAALRARWTGEQVHVLVLTAAPDQLETVRRVLAMRGNDYVARHETVKFHAAISAAIAAGHRWREEKKDDDRLEVARWADAKVTVGNDGKIFAQTRNRRRAVSPPPGEKLTRTLLGLAGLGRAGRAADGVDLLTVANAKSQASRLSSWLRSYFRYETADNPFTSHASHVFASVRVTLARDPGERDDFMQMRRRTES